MRWSVNPAQWQGRSVWHRGVSKWVGISLLWLSALAASPLHAQTVNFYAWGGSPQVNDYLQWVSAQTQARFGITVNHVKLADTSDAVSRVLAEKAAGNHANGQIDLLWINGENFAAMKQHGLLLKDWVHTLEHFTLTNPAENPNMTRDFGVPTDGQEAPWGKAAMVFYYNQSRLAQPPQNAAALLRFAQAHPGRFAYPLPADYLGISFLKYLVMALNPDQHPQLFAPVTPAALDQVTPALFAYLDALHPHLWQQGRFFPRQAARLTQLMGDEQLWLAFSFTAAEIPAAVQRYDLPAATRTYAMTDGSLANVHFVAIPYNSDQTQAARKVVNFLLSPEAQAKKYQPDVWGDDTVLDVSLLPAAQQALFAPAQRHPAALPASGYHTLLPEPHASWSDALREAWYARYGAHL